MRVLDDSKEVAVEGAILFLRKNFGESAIWQLLNQLSHFFGIGPNFFQEFFPVFLRTDGRDIKTELVVGCERLAPQHHQNSSHKIIDVKNERRDGVEVLDLCSGLLPAQAREVIFEVRPSPVRSKMDLSQVPRYNF